MCNLTLDWIGISHEIWDCDCEKHFENRKKRKKNLKPNWITRVPPDCHFSFHPTSHLITRKDAADTEHHHTFHYVTHCWHDPLLITRLNFWLPALLPRRQSTNHLPEFLFWASVFKEEQRRSKSKMNGRSTELNIKQFWSLGPYLKQKDLYFKTCICIKKKLFIQTYWDL